MPIIAITREMGSLGKDVAAGLGKSLGLPTYYHEVVEPLADRMRVRKSHVIRLLDGTAGLLERLTADKTSMAIFSADEIFDLALKGQGAVGAVRRKSFTPRMAVARCSSEPMNKAILRASSVRSSGARFGGGVRFLLAFFKS